MTTINNIRNAFAAGLLRFATRFFLPWLGAFALDLVLSSKTAQGGEIGRGPRVLVIMQDLLSNDIECMEQGESRLHYLKISAGFFFLLYRGILGKGYSAYDYDEISRRSPATFEALDRYWRALLPLWLKRSKFKAVITANHVYAARRSFYTVCREVGLPVFVLHKEATLTPSQLEILFSDGVYATVSFEPSHLLAFNPAFAKKMIQRGLPPETVFLTGMPRIDDVLASPPPMGRDVVFFFSVLWDKEVLVRNTDLIDEGVQAIARFTADFIRCAESFPHRNFHIKIKNKENHKKIIDDILDTVGRRPPNLFIVREGNSIDLIRKAKYVVALCSTTLVEAAAQGRVLIEPDVVPSPLAEELFYFLELQGDSIKVSTKEELAAVLADETIDGCDVEFRREILEFYNGYAESGASRRVEDAILGVIAPD